MKRSITCLFLFGLLLQGCGKAQTEQKAESQNTLSGKIEIRDGWVREGASGMMSAAYFTIYNGTANADTLWSISAFDVSDDVQIHESYKTEDDLMGMRPVGAIPVPSGQSVELKPGGIHIMIIQPYQDIKEGMSIEFQLNFSSGDIVISLPVQKTQ